MISKKSYAQLEGSSRHKKASKIASILGCFVNFSKCDVLDIGVGSGHIASDLARKSKSLVGVDLYDERVIKSGYLFKKVDDEYLPFNNSKFDVVISNHVIEHISNQTLHVNEISRVLKNGGILYLATPNKYWLFDPHSKLPLISWFSRRVSSIYLKLFENKKWDIYPLSYRKIKRLFKNHFEIYNMTYEIIKNPKKYHLDVFLKIQPLFSLFPSFLLKLLFSLVPTYVLIMRKK